MTKPGSRVVLVLAVAVVALVAVVVTRRSEAPAGRPAVPASAARGAAAAGAKTAMVADVKLELLQAQGSDLGPSSRNPFQFKPKPLPPPPRAVDVARLEAPVVVGPPPPPPGPPPPPPITLKYIGVMETGQGKVAIFRDTGGDIVNGKEGDIIDGRYRLVKIGVESADLVYPDGRGRQTIRLSGQ